MVQVGFGPINSAGDADLFQDWYGCNQILGGFAQAKVSIDLTQGDLDL